MNWLNIALRMGVLVLLGHPPSGPIFPLDEVVGAILKLTNGGRMIDATNLTTNLTENVIRRCGYRQETHRVVTDDGYILTLHRIPAAENNDSDSDSDNVNDNSTTTTVTSKKPPILMLHGFLGDGLSYVIKGNHSSPAFIFNDAGYDVWLINVRGTRYSRKHVSLNPDVDKQFWNYCFHEMGIYDVPATVTYILSTTNADQLYLVGHSMGGTYGSIFLSEKPEYASKVKALFLWSPAVKLGRTKYPMAGRLRRLTDALMELFNDMELVPSSPNLILFARNQCTSYYGSYFCDWIIEALTDYEIPTKQETYLETLAITLSATSVKAAKHFLQMIERNDFSQYDYGARNFRKYNQESPPPYNLSKITVPTWFMSSQYDYIVNATDVAEAAQQFQNAKIITLQRPPGWPNFSHIDFIVGDDIKVVVCNPMLREMSKLEADPETEMERMRLIMIVVFMCLAAAFIVGLLTYFASKAFRAPHSDTEESAVNEN